MIYRVLLVCIGGFLGTTARVLLSELLPQHLGVPLGVILANVVGSFALGWLVQVFAHSTVRRAPELRLLIGTGVLGGFTTYSALAGDTARLLLNGHALASIAYGLGTVFVSLIASFAGIWVGLVLRRRDPATGSAQ